jgi:hypothetical protein
MPYADPDRQREYNRILARTRYQQDAEFRADEALRKRIWYYKHQLEILERKKLWYQRNKILQKLIDLISDYVTGTILRIPD